MAKYNRLLEDVAAPAEGVIMGTKSLGMSLDTCTVPGSPKEDRIPAGKAELSLGIHGEAGVEQIDFVSAKQAMAAITDKLAALMETKPHVVLLNNPRGSSVLEMPILANELTTGSISKHLKAIIGPASMLTSLYLRGFSVSIYPVNAENAALFAEPCDPAGWLGFVEFKKVDVVELPDGLTPIQPVPSEHAATADLI